MIRDDDLVTQMGLDDGRLLIRRGVLLGLAQLDEGHRLPAGSTVEAALGTAVHQLHQKILLHIEKLVQIHSAVGEFAERALLLNSLGFGRIGHGCGIRNFTRKMQNFTRISRDTTSSHKMWKRKESLTTDLLRMW